MTILVLRPAGPRAAAGSRQSGTRQSGTRQPGARPVGARRVGARPVGARQAGPHPARSRPPGTAPAGSRLRLTRRGRLAVRGAVGLLGLLVTVAAVLAGGQVARAGEDTRPLPVSYHVVAPGETLWQIAGRVAPDTDRRDTVARIVELNALPSAALRAGQRIAVPATP